MLDAKARYDATEETTGPAEEAAWQTYSKATDAYNKCLDAVDALVNYRDYGGTMPWSPETTAYEWPKEVPNPAEEPSQPLPQPSPVASVHEPVQQPAQPPQPPQAPSVATTDWRFEGCPPGYQRIVRGGACVPPGLLSTGLNMPGTTTTPMTSAVLQGRIRVAPLYRGRF